MVISGFKATLMATPLGLTNVRQTEQERKQIQGPTLTPYNSLRNLFLEQSTAIPIFCETKNHINKFIYTLNDRYEKNSNQRFQMGPEKS